MPKFVIERDMPGVGALPAREVVTASKGSNEALAKLGKQIQWVHSYVTANKIYCVYIAPNEEMIREHGRLTGLPVTAVARIHSTIDPTTAEG